MTTPFQSSSNHKTTFYSTGQKRTGLIERIAVVASATAIALFVVVDIVKSAPLDTPLAAQTFRSVVAAAAAEPAASDEQWAPDESANGTRPDSTH